MMSNFRELPNVELAQKLQKNPGHKGMTSELFDRSEIDSSQAIDLFIHGHPHWRRRAFGRVRQFALEQCYAPAEFELMIRHQPDYMEDLLDLMHASSSGRATDAVHTRAIKLKNLAAAVAV